MGTQKTCVVAALIIAILAILAYYAHKKGWLGAHLWGGEGFVGAYGRTPGMEGCIAYGGPGGRTPFFNRCTWV